MSTKSFTKDIIVSKEGQKILQRILEHGTDECPYCYDECNNKELKINDYISAFIHLGELCIMSETVDIWFPITYCPFCGRKL